MQNQRELLAIKLSLTEHETNALVVVIQAGMADQVFTCTGRPDLQSALARVRDRLQRAMNERVPRM